MGKESIPFEPLGLVHPALDAHTLGPSALADILTSLGLCCHIGGADIAAALHHPQGNAESKLLCAWIQEHRIRALGYSFRLDPQEGREHFGRFVHFLESKRLLKRQGGPIQGVFFAGLPDTCALIAQDHPWLDGIFNGEESQTEVLQALGLAEDRIPLHLHESSRYDQERMELASSMLKKVLFNQEAALDWTGSPQFGTAMEKLTERIDFARAKGYPPLMRAHVGPWDPDRMEALKIFSSWCKELGESGYLDILSIGSSQLSQEAFEQDWGGKSNGGGVPFQNRQELLDIWHASRPMLVRTYAGTLGMPHLALIYEETINPAWHTFSFWWFNKLDGRGPLSLRASLAEHFATLKIVAGEKRPFEANTSHHFAFRGADDVTYVLSGYLAALAAKAQGVRTYIVQVMLNTPKHQSPAMDLAKARALVELVRSMEDKDFRVLVQPRGGLDYFSTDLHKARLQLAAVSMMMDDIEPDRSDSPELIHVVSYSEARSLADPGIVNESVRITRAALRIYRAHKASTGKGFAPEDVVQGRTAELIAETRQVLAAIQEHIPSYLSAEGFHEIFAAGYLPVPWLWACREDYPRAVDWQTGLRDGKVVCLDPHGQILTIEDRLARIREYAP